MNRSPLVGTLWGSAIRLHGSWALMVVGILGYSLVAYTWESALFFVLLYFATSLCVFAQLLLQKLVAYRFGIGTRDITLGPLWGVSRLMTISERPWQENYIALMVPITHLMLGVLVGGILLLAGFDVRIQPEEQRLHFDPFLVHLFWVNMLLALFNLLPMLPLAGGTIFRAALAMTTGRLRATEVAAILSTVGAIALAMLAVLWLHSPFVVSLAILIYFASQEEVRTTRFFASLTHANDDHYDQPAPIMAPTEQLLPADCQPNEPNFTGFTWNAKLRLWVEWRNGEAIRANALVGE